MRTRFVALPAAVAASLVFAACGTAESSTGSSSSGAPAASASENASATTDENGAVTVKHAQGTTELKSTPKRIAVLDYAALDTIDALDGSVVAVPKKTLPDELKKYSAEKYVNAGSLKEPDLEKLRAAKPDLIVISGRAAPKYKELAKIAPTVDVTQPGKSIVADFKAQTNTLGTILGKKDEVAAKAQGIDADVAALKKKGQGAGTGLVVMVSGGKLSAFGEGSRFGMIHSDFGIKQAVDGLKQDRHGQAVSFEFVNQAKPDHIFVIDRDSATGESGKSAKAVMDNALVKATPAGKNGKIHYLDGADWYLVSNGINTLPRMIDEVSTSLD